MSEDNVLKFPGVEEVDYESPPSPEVELDDLFKAAYERDFKDAIIIGNLVDNSIYFATTSGDPKNILYSLERAKMILMLSDIANSKISEDSDD